MERRRSGGKETEENLSSERVKIKNENRNKKIFHTLTANINPHKFPCITVRSCTVLTHQWHNTTQHNAILHSTSQKYESKTPPQIFFPVHPRTYSPMTAPTIELIHPFSIRLDRNMSLWAMKDKATIAHSNAHLLDCCATRTRTCEVKDNMW